MRLVAYIRVSATSGRDPTVETSAPDQRRAIEQYVAGRDVEIVEWIEDFDQSGGKWERPGFQRALTMIDSREVDGVIVAKLDRFSRSLINALRAIERLDAAHAQFISVADGFDTTKPMGRAMMQIAAVFAELERARLAENWQLQQADAIERGVQIARAPIAYLRGDDGRLVPDPTAAPAVREMFLHRARGASLRDCANELEAKLGRGFSGPMVGKMLRNRTYLGEVRRGNLGANPDAHEPIVSRAEFEAAQVTYPSAPHEHRGSLLAGFVRCAGCSYPLKRTNAKGLPMYRCHGRHKAGRCPEPVNVSMQRLDEFVEAAVVKRLRAKSSRVRVERRSGDLDAALAKLENVEAQLATYRDADVIDVIGADAYRDGLRVRRERVDEARRAVADAQGVAVLPFGLTGEGVWRDGTLDERRILLAALVDAVFVRRAHSRGKGTPIDDRVVILWSGDAPGDLPGRNGGRMSRYVFDDECGDAAGVASAGDRQ